MLELARRFTTDVVLMDIRMPKLDGLAATRRLLAEDGRARVVILTTFDLDEYVFEAIKAGASGFLLKDSPPDQLIAAINVVASGDALLAPSITRRLVEEFVHRPTPRERPPELPSDSERIPATASDVARAAVVIVGSKEYRP